MKRSVALLAKLSCSQVVPTPYEAGVTDARRVHVGRGRKQSVDHRTLCNCVADGAERQAERVCNEDRARWLDDCRNFDVLRNGDGAESGLVEYSLKQSDGLLADRSSWGQQHQVRAV
jgi:hypothetical protein